MPRPVIGRFAIFLLCGTVSMNAAQRTFVSAENGSDANLCTRQLPCRNFAAAIAQTDSKGEVIVLDSGGYGTTTITSSVSIISPAGVYAGITAFASTAGISIAAGSTDVVTLEGLHLNGLGGTRGVETISVGTLHVERCVATGFSSTGFFFAPTSAGELYVSNSVSKENNDGFHAYAGIGVLSKVTIQHSRAENNLRHGFWLEQITGVLVDDVASGNGNTGILVEFSTGGADVESCTVAWNLMGIRATNTALIRVANSLVTRNGTGLSNTIGSDLLSRISNSVKTNTVEGNGSGESFTGTYDAK
jgi:parallel beta helix pectate lyase-like protein